MSAPIRLSVQRLSSIGMPFSTSQSIESRMDGQELQFNWMTGDHTFGHTARDTAAWRVSSVDTLTVVTAENPSSLTAGSQSQKSSLDCPSYVRPATDIFEVPSNWLWQAEQLVELHEELAGLDEDAFLLELDRYLGYSHSG